MTASFHSGRVTHGAGSGADGGGEAQCRRGQLGGLASVRTWSERADCLPAARLPAVDRVSWRTGFLKRAEVVGEDAPRPLPGGPVSARGVVYVHSAPPALCPHVEWAAAGVLGVSVSLPWVSQPAAPGMMRAELGWQGRPGTAGAITSALAGWNRLRFEVTEEASPGCDAVRYSYTPSLGTFTAVTGGNGDVLVPENRAARGDGARGRWRSLARGRTEPPPRPAMGRRARAIPLCR